MDDETTDTEEETEESETASDEELGEGAMTIDVEAIDEYESRIDELTSKLDEREQTIEELESVVEDQQERLSDLEGQFRDLSARVADGRNLGVCPDCNGPTERKNRLFRSDTIECNRCGNVIYTY